MYIWKNRDFTTVSTVFRSAQTLVEWRLLWKLYWPDTTRWKMCLEQNDYWIKVCGYTPIFPRHFYKGKQLS